MKKGIVIGVAIAIIIGIGMLAISQNYSEDVSEIPLNDVPKNEPSQFTVGLDESVGFSGG